MEGTDIRSSNGVQCGEEEYKHTSKGAGDMLSGGIEKAVRELHHKVCVL